MLTNMSDENQTPPNSTDGAKGRREQRLVRLFPIPWTLDYYPQEAMKRSYAVIYAADHSRITQVNGPESKELAQGIIDAVNDSWPNAQAQESPESTQNDE